MTTTEGLWGRFPSPWVFSGGLIQFQAVNKASLAALRVYLAMACWTSKQNFDAQPGVFIRFAITYNDLQRNSHSDRSELLPALELLSKINLLTFGNSGRGTRNIYQLLGDPSKGWSKVPEAVLDQLEHLNLKYTGVAIHFRRQILLDALKLYVLFLALRTSKTNHAKVSYVRIWELTGIRKKGATTAISLLVSLKMIHIQNCREPDAAGSNYYFVMGLGNFRTKETGSRLS